MSKPRTPVEQRFWGKVDRRGPGECWLWLASKTGSGYGQIGVDGSRALMAHRVAYELLVGPIPAGLHLDHLCRVPACVNPAHLEPVTPYENARRSPLTGAGKTHCKRGHPFDEANTYVTPGGQRQCRTCRRDFDRRRPSKRQLPEERPCEHCGQLYRPVIALAKCRYCSRECKDRAGYLRRRSAS